MSFLLHVLNANRCSTPAATVFPIPCLCSDFRPVLEGHPDIVFAVHLELSVAAVDGPAVLVGRMPHLGPVPASAPAALDAADRLRNDEVDFPIHGIPDHPLEAIAVTRVSSRDAFIGVDADEFPVIPLLDVIRVIVHLCGIAGNLVIMVRGNTGITSYSPILPAVNRGQ